MIFKNCTKCGTTKQTKEFSKHESRYDGLQSSCKTCRNISAKKYRQTKDGLIAQIYGNQLAHSKQRGHELPSYSRDELKAWVYSHPNFEALYKAWVDSGYDKWLTPSVDRADDYKPYSIDNLLRLCTWQENYDRGNTDMKNGINNKTSTAVVQMNLDGTFVQEHYSMCAAERKTGVANGNISNCCNGKSKSAGGFRWMVSIGFPCVGLGV